MGAGAQVSRLEKEIQREVIKVLRLHGYEVDDMTQPRATMMPLGLPDLRAVSVRHKDRFWLEVKRPGEEPTDYQRDWHERETAAGGAVYVVRSAHDAHTICMERRGL